MPKCSDIQVESFIPSFKAMLLLPDNFKAEFSPSSCLQIGGVLSSDAVRRIPNLLFPV